MKFITWNPCDEIEAFTTCSYDQGRNMNMSFYAQDSETVLEVRKDLVNSLNTTFDKMVATHQQHTTRFIEVSHLDGGKGITNKETAIEAYDAMYTKDSDLWLLSFHADCTPVLLYAPDKKIVAEIHSGWVGTVKEIVNKTLHHLIQQELCDPSLMYAYIGPCLSQKNFQAQDDIINQVKEMSFDTSSFYQQNKDGSYQLDNKGLVLQQLLNNHLSRENITVSPYCTFDEEELFFSYRRNKTADRNVTLIRRK